MNVEFLSQLLLSPLSPSSRGSLVLGGVLCLSEVIDIFPSNLDSSLRFIQPNILHDVLCIDKINKQGDNIQP